jgi:hypothetical protein
VGTLKLELGLRHGHRDIVPPAASGFLGVVNAYTFDAGWRRGLWASPG